MEILNISIEEKEKDFKDSQAKHAKRREDNRKKLQALGIDPNLPPQVNAIKKPRVVEEIEEEIPIVMELLAPPPPPPPPPSIPEEIEVVEDEVESADEEAAAEEEEGWYEGEGGEGAKHEASNARFISLCAQA